MGKYFTLEELTASSIARAKRIDNTPPPGPREKLERLITYLLDPVRELWGAAVIVNSGYRSPELNRAVGGVLSSQHVRGEAADITAGSPRQNRMLFGKIVASGLVFDQLIDERDYTWLHISFSDTNRKQILHL